MAETLTIRTASSTEVIKVAIEGPQGPAGANGQGVPTGGSTGQVLRKASSANYDTEWATGGGGGVSSWNDLEDKPSTFTPSAHKTSHSIGGTDALSPSDIGAAPATGIDPTAISGTAVVDSDARLSDTRTPTAHAASHAAGQADELFDQSLNTTDSPTFNEITAYKWIGPNLVSNILFDDTNIIVQGNVAQFDCPIDFGNPQAAEDSRTNLGLEIGTDVAAASHTHELADITDAGTAAAEDSTAFATSAQGDKADSALQPTLVDAKGDLLVGSAADTVSRLAVGATNGHVLKINSATATGLEWGAAPAGDTVSIDASAADILSATSGAISADDAGADRIVYWNNTSNKLAYGTASDVGAAAASHTHAASDIASGTIDTARLGSGTANNTTYLRGDQTWATVTAGVSGSTSTDNAIVRADSTANTVQESGLVIDDYTSSTQGNVTLATKLVSFSCTATASDDFVTATGHTFANGDQVVFTSLTGGTGLSTNTRYFVVSSEANKFKCSSTSGGVAINITADATAGTVQLLNSVVIDPRNVGSFILGPKPDGTTTGGNARGLWAIDLQWRRSAATQVASGNNSAILGGHTQTASGSVSAVIAGYNNTATHEGATCLGSANSLAGGKYNSVIASGGSTSNGFQFAACIASASAQASAENGLAIGSWSLADRFAMIAQASGPIGQLGSGQRAHFVVYKKVSSETATELLIGGSTRLTVPSGKVMACLINICAITSGGEFANHYVRRVMIANRGGTTALRGSVTDISTDEGIAGADVSVTADDTNDSINISFSGVAQVTGCTGTASTDKINKTSHGFSNNDDIIFTSLTGGAGITANTITYWVINANADDFQVSATRGGTAVNITTDYSDMTAARLFRVVASVDAVEVAYGT